MKQAHVESEYRALLTLVSDDVDKKVKGLLLGSLKSGHFSYEATAPVYTHIVEIAAKTGTVPSFETIRSIPGLTTVMIQSLGAFASTNRPITDEDGVKEIIAVLDYYRKFRLVLSNTTSTVSELQVEVPDMKKITELMEKTLVSVKTTADEVPKWDFGTGSNVQPLIERVLSTERTSGIPTGFDVFDKITGGFQPGNLIALASHYKGGKSIVALNIGMNQAYMGKKVLYVPFEMNDEETTRRMLSKITGIDSTKFNHAGGLSAYEQKLVIKALMKWEDDMAACGGTFSIQALSTATPEEIQARFRAFKYDVIYLDYLKLMEPSSGRSENEAVRNDTIGMELKRIAGQMGSVIVGLAQLDENTESLRYSKALFEHANNVWAWMYKEAERTAGIINVKQLAARSWEPFPFQLRVDFARTLVEDAPLDSAAILESFNNSSNINPIGMF